MSRSQRSLIAQLRCSVLPIAIEIGRYTNKAVQDRLCTLSNTANVEDEFHFVCHCHLYNNLRTQWYEDAVAINTKFFNFTTDDKFVFLLTESILCRPLGQYIIQAWRIRQEKLYQ